MTRREFLVLPGASSVLAQTIRERCPALPILLATGYNKAAAGAAGGFTVLRKPYQLPDLGSMVGRLIAEGRRRA